jgi:hypothetical protein
MIFLACSLTVLCSEIRDWGWRDERCFCGGGGKEYPEFTFWVIGFERK